MGLTVNDVRKLHASYLISTTAEVQFTNHFKGITQQSSIYIYYYFQMDRMIQEESAIHAKTR